MDRHRKIIDTCLTQIIFQDIVLARIAAMLDKIAGEWVGTMGVASNKCGGVNMFYSTKFMDKLIQTKEVEKKGKKVIEESYEWIQAIVVHELLHICLAHIYRKGNREANIAADIAINQFIPDLAAIPKEIGFKPFMIDSFNPPLPPKLSREEYYLLLKERQEELEKLIGQGYTTADNHDEWKEGEYDIFKEQVREIIKECAKEGKNWGSYTGGMISEITAAYNKAIDWRRVTRTFTKSILSRNNKNSRRTINKKYGNMFPGKRRQYEANLLVAMDTSGSISDEDLSFAAGSMMDLMDETKVSVTFVQWDTQITSVDTKWRKSAKVKVTGHGGTDVNCVCEYARKEKKFDGIIIFTDGYFGEADFNGLPRLLWVFTKDGDNPGVPGTKTRFKNYDKI